MNKYQLLKALRFSLFDTEYPTNLMGYPPDDETLFSSQDRLLNSISILVATYQGDFLRHIRVQRDVARLTGCNESRRDCRAFDSLDSNSYSRLVSACSSVGLLGLSMELLRERPAVSSAFLRL